MKKLTVITIVTLFLSTTPVFAEYPGGSGTQADPWQIACPNDLLYLAGHPEDYDSHFILTADINLADYTFTTAVIAQDINSLNPEFDGTEFTGTFNGSSFAIRNLTIDTNDDANDFLGLFGSTGSGCEIKRLGVEDVNITGGDYSSDYLGGLVGYNYKGAISNCYVTGTVEGGHGSLHVGGLVGENDEGTLSNCYATGDVNGAYYPWLGGLVGTNRDGEISNCYATADVNGGDYALTLGGLVGSNYEGTISNCYATGNINCGIYPTYLGGLVGFNNEGAISNCFWDIETSNCNTSAGGTPKTTAEMKTKSTFTDAGWDFVDETANGTEDIWRMCIDGVNYPLLSWEFNIADFVCPDGVDFIDFSVLALAWWTEDGEPNWNPICDISDPNDGVIDAKDLDVFCDNWLAGL